MEEKGTQLSFLAPTEAAKEAARKQLMALLEENLLLMREIGALYDLPQAKKEGQVIQGPQSVANLLIPEMGALEQEQMKVVLLDTGHRVLGIEMVYQGTLHTTLVRIGELFREAVRRNAAAVILVHNHPSDALSPSPQDLELTRVTVEAGELLNVKVEDHLIIGRRGYKSLRDTHEEIWK